VQVEVPDLKGRVDGIIKLLEQSEGKPQDGQSLGTTIVVERLWPDAPLADGSDQDGSTLANKNVSDGG
jgi:hypothetical protein